MNTYSINWVGYSGREYCDTVVAETTGKAKYRLYLEQEMDCGFGTFLKHVVKSCRVLHRFRVSDLYGDIDRFNEMKDRRGIPFAHMGMRVEVDGKPGIIVGSNYSGNLDVCFDGTSCGSNCHPHWMTRYFDANGDLIKEYMSTN